VKYGADYAMQKVEAQALRLTIEAFEEIEGEFSPKKSGMELRGRGVAVDVTAREKKARFEEAKKAFNAAKEKKMAQVYRRLQERQREAVKAPVHSAPVRKRGTIEKAASKQDMPDI
jgi:hypothetical protein